MFSTFSAFISLPTDSTSLLSCKGETRNVWMWRISSKWLWSYILVVVVVVVVACLVCRSPKWWSIEQVARESLHKMGTISVVEHAVVICSDRCPFLPPPKLINNAFDENGNGVGRLCSSASFPPMNVLIDWTCLAQHNLLGLCAIITNFHKFTFQSLFAVSDSDGERRESEWVSEREDTTARWRLPIEIIAVKGRTNETKSLLISLCQV